MVLSAEKQFATGPPDSTRVEASAKWGLFFGIPDIAESNKILGIW